LPQIPVPPLAQGAAQAAIDVQIQHLDLYQVIIVNRQIVIQNLTHNALQPQAACDKMRDEPLQVTDRGAQGMVLTIGRVKGEGVVDCKVE